MGVRALGSDLVWLFGEEPYLGILYPGFENPLFNLSKYPVPYLFLTLPAVAGSDFFPCPFTLPPAVAVPLYPAT